LKESELLEDLGMDGKITLKRIVLLKKLDVRIGFVWLRRVYSGRPF
jgi:hypothetical protein